LDRLVLTKLRASGIPAVTGFKAVIAKFKQLGRYVGYGAGLAAWSGLIDLAAV